MTTTSALTPSQPEGPWPVRLRAVPEENRMRAKLNRAFIVPALACLLVSPTLGQSDSGRSKLPRLTHLELSVRLDFEAERFERGEREAQIQRALDALPPDEKAVAVLCDIEGKSYDETAALTGAPLGTVKSRLARARRRLRSKLEGIV